MATSFIVNLEDLNRILDNIKIAEQHAAGGNLVDIINQAAGPGNAAAIVPMGLRTVDGSYNHLLPGDTSVGAADTLFPRLLTPTWRNDQDGDQMPLGPQGSGAPTITNTNYNSAVSVADADPRIISNLIVDSTIKNPAALDAALRLAVPDTVPAADVNAWVASTAIALVSAYNAWKAADTASDAKFTAVANSCATALGANDTDHGTDFVKAKITEARLALTLVREGLDDDSDFLDQADTDAAAAAAAAASAALAEQSLILSGLQNNLDIPVSILTAATNLKTALQNLVDSISGTGGIIARLSDNSASIADFNKVLQAESAASSVFDAASLNELALQSEQQSALNQSKSALDTAFKALVTGAGLEISSDNSIMIPHQSADIGLSPANSGWMTLFGQFFDHGLDLVTKGGNGTVYIPLQPDDPLYVPGGPNFMALTRATQMDAARNTQNTTTPFVDQNQTYTSSASHQVFLREYKLDENDHAINTGRLLNGAHGGIANWAEVKAQAQTMLGLKLSDFDVHDVPLLEVDQYGKFKAGADGFAQVVVKIDVVDSSGVVQGTVPSQNGNFTVEGKTGGLDLRTIAVGDVNLHGQTLALLAPGLSYVVSVAHTGHAFLNDIAHHAAPGLVDHDRNPATPKISQVADADIDRDGDGDYDLADLDVNGDGDVADGELQGLVADQNNDGVVNLADVDRNNDDSLTIADFDINGDGVLNSKDLTADDGRGLTYDDEMLNAHFITGDGRGNENIGLTAVHTVFHSEHNRVMEANKVTLIKSFDAANVNQWLRPNSTGQDNQVTQAQLDTIKAIADPGDQAAAITALIQTLDNRVSWDGERMFQAARFTTEMQYQHMVFEEFARRVQPNVDPFVFTNSADIDPSIVAEFAHVVYRFGHSQLTDSVDRLTNDLGLVNDPSSPAGQIGLIQAFLNPQSFTASGINDEAATGAIIRGMSRQVGNELDEFVVESLRSNLVGLPLDLAALNIARGRDTGVPGLNEARAQLYAASGQVDVKPYTSWQDFANNLKHPLSVVNFIAAYGTHNSVTSAATLDAKRDAAFKLVFGGNGAPADRLDFLHATSTYAGGKLGGLNDVDFWVGGLAEAHPEFGGQLGTTFNYVFEYQLEHLQNGDRFYYLSRTQGMNLLNLLEANTFSDIIMRNTDLGGLHATHLSAEIMEVPDMILELDGQVAQENYSGNATTTTRWDLDPTWETGPTSGNAGPKVIRIMDDKDATGAAVQATASGVVLDYDHKLEFHGGEHVVLGGTEGRDVLLGDKGIDTLWGDGGNDYLNAGTESDQVFGGDGDDIIEDPFGDDFLRGEAGDDVVVSSSGIDVMFGGTGNDFLQIGTDSSEIFAGPGDDFLLGGSAPDVLLGNEGDDWLEGGEGFDSLSGENSELFFNSPIVGHDILWGQANDTDYDGENGDDIMVQGSGIQRNNGMEGFDWAIHKGDTKADGTATDAVSDMTNLLGAGAVNPAFILRDRFDSVEGLSGWKGNDTLLGASLLVVAGGGFDARLTQAGVDRINGLKHVVGSVGDGVDPRLTTNAANATVLSNDFAFNGGEIILGGAGSDKMMGALGNDIMDGDAWLNIRISVHENKVPVGVNNHDIAATNPEIFTVNSLTETISSSNALYNGKNLAELMRTGVINPGQLKAVREVLNSDGTLVTAAGSKNSTTDIDTAAFRYSFDQYKIEGTDTNNDGVISGLEIRDTNNDGYIRVEHVPVGQGGGALRNSDGVDQIRNFEVLEFADRTEIIQAGIVNAAATGNLAITINNGPNPFNIANRLEVGDTLTVNVGTVADADGVPALSAFTFTWQQSINDPVTGAITGWEDIVNPVTEEVITGQTFTPTAAYLLDGLSLRVVGRFTDAHGFRETVLSTVTAPVTGTAPVVPDPAAELGFDFTIAPNNVGPDGVTVNLADFAPGAAIGIFEDVIDNDPTTTITAFEITRAALVAKATDIDTLQTNLQVRNLALRGDGVVVTVSGLTTISTDPAQGVLTVNRDANGNMVSASFDPAQDFNGGITFTYDISDGTNLTFAEATLNVIAVNDAPTNPNALLGTTLAGTGATPVTFTIAQLFGSTPVDGSGRPIDIDGDRLTIDPTTVASPNGAVTFDVATGIFTWTPNAAAKPENLDIVINFQIDDGTGLANAVTNATARIDAVNAVATGSVVISDTTPAEGQTLTVNTGTIADLNGLGAITVTWQSSADFNAVTPVITTLGTGTSLTVPTAAVGQTIRAVASFTDQGGTVERVISTVTSAVVANAAPVGAPLISEVITLTNPVSVQITPTEGQQLTASAVGISDADGFSTPITFQWQSSSNGTTWTNINNATNATFTPQDLALNAAGAQAGLQLRVVASYVDGLGKPETVVSAATAPVGQNWTAVQLLAPNFTGTAGDDIAAGGIGNNSLNGGAGNDRLIYTVTTGLTLLTSGRDFIDGGTTALVGNNRDTGSDTFVLNGSAAAETFRIYTRAAFQAVAGNGAVALNANSEIVVTRNGTNGASIIAELDNIEEIVVNTLDVTANNNNGGLDVTPAGGGGDTIQVIGNFNAPNTSLNFSTITINGGTAADTVDISGLTSDHRIVFNGGGGGDVVVGPARPQDVVTNAVVTNNVGTNNADTFYGLNGKFTFAGKNGNDVYVIDADDTIVELAGGGTDEVRSAMSIDLGKYANVENATLLGNQAFNAKGNDLDNVLNGNDGANTLNGGKGADKLFGGSGADDLDGGLGNDRLDGGQGNDILRTGAGDDVIVVNRGFGNDRVIGFDAYAPGGQDKIDLVALGITRANFNAHVTIVDKGGDTLVKIDDGSLLLEGVKNHKAVTIDDFWLAS